MKKVVLILLVVLLAGCSSNEDSLSKVEEFEMKLACRQLVDDFEERVEYFSFGSTTGKTLEVFYSPKENSCLFVTKQTNDFMETDNRSFEIYQLRDVLRNLIIDTRSGCMGSETACADYPDTFEASDDFYSMVQEYR